VHIYEVTKHTGNGYGTLIDALRYNGNGKRYVVFRQGGNYSIPHDDWVIEGSSNIVVLGRSAPANGVVHIVDHPLCLSNCRDISLNDLVFTLKSATTPGNAIWWNPLKILGDRPNSTSDILVRRCHFRGGNDEIPVGPSNITKYGVQYGDAPVGSNIIFSQCWFAFPFRAMRGKDGTVGRHNFHLMLTGIENFEISYCTFCHANRRSPQVRGTGTIANNIIYNYGSSAIAIMGNSVVDVYGNSCYAGKNTKMSEPREIPFSIEPGYNGKVILYSGLNFYNYRSTQQRPESLNIVNEVPGQVELIEMPMRNFDTTLFRPNSLTMALKNDPMYPHYRDFDRAWAIDESEFGGIPSNLLWGT
jgi:hypothetical protein